MTCCKTLTAYCRNVYNNLPDEGKRSIKKDNKALNERVACMPGGLDFLAQVGFEVRLHPVCELGHAGASGCTPSQLWGIRQVLCTGAHRTLVLTHGAQADTGVAMPAHLSRGCVGFGVWRGGRQ